jgi:alkylation response protein AidB-like acyl-CoA dehydrogenase
MRASGSNSVSFEGVELSEPGVRGGFRVGDATPYIERNLIAGLFHASASLGIAESADQVARRGVVTRMRSTNFGTNHPRTRGTTHVPARVSPADGREARPATPPRISDNHDARARMHVADNAIDLAAARGVLARAAMLIDEHRTANPTSDGTAEELGTLFAEAQAAKAFVGEASTRIVDRALALSGGAGYVNGSLLARAYRDVKAGSFMHPLGANRAYDYLADVALDEQPALH